MRARLSVTVAVVIASAALLAGCGGGGGGGSSSTSAVDWAAGYCAAATTWVTALTDARASVQAGNPTATPSDAVQTLSAATNTLVTSMDDLGQPDTPDGATSEASAKTLANTLQGRVGRAQFAIDTNNSKVTNAMRAATVRTQVTAMLGDVTSTTAKLGADDAALGTAMTASSDCADLKTALAKAM